MESEANSGAESEDSVSDVIDATTFQWLALPKGKAHIANADATGPICHRKLFNAEWGVGITSATAAIQNRTAIASNDAHHQCSSSVSSSEPP